ncbi:MAG: ferritin-like protein [Armatimonadota bacterium]
MPKHDLSSLTQQLKELQAGSGISCLRDSVQAAISLEFATIPPYLAAMWSVRDPTDRVRSTIRGIVLEEMLHMGLACNLLAGLGGYPDFTASVPSYPGALPGSVHPSLVVKLSRLTPDQLSCFMEIEFPSNKPIGLVDDPSFPTIGDFYSELLKAFERINPPLDRSRQREIWIASDKLFVIESIEEVRRAIDTIRKQGEGSSESPEETEGELAHYYQFREVFAGAEFVQDVTTQQWSHTGRVIEFPQVWPMADIPSGGYSDDAVHDNTVKGLLIEFDETYSEMLRQLESVWRDPNAPFGNYENGDPVGTMLQLEQTAKSLMQKERPDQRGNYGPCFRYRTKS